MSPAIIPTLNLAAARAAQLAANLRHAQAGGIAPTRSHVAAEIAALQRLMAEAQGYVEGRPPPR